MYILKSVTFITAEFVVNQQYEVELIRKHYCMAHGIPKEVKDNIKMNFKDRGFRGWKLD